MSIRKEENGTYTLDYYIKDAVTGKRERKKKRGFRTKAEAKKFEDLLSSDSSSITFYQLFIEHQNSLDQNKETMHDKIRLIERYIPLFKVIKYSNLTKPYLTKVRGEIAQLDLSPVRKNKILSIIKSTCRYANDIYDLKDNSRVMKTFSVKKPKIKIWSMEEYQRFEEVCDDEFKAFFHLIFFTGLRKGEAKALLVDDLDVENSTISIHNAMRKGVSSYGNTKNEQSVRIVQIDKYTLDMLKPLKSHEKWLFGDSKPLANTTIDRHFHNASDKANLKRIRIHDLRHSHCSILIGNGIDVVSVASRVGHADINTTLSTYAHVLEDSDNKIVNFLDKYQNSAK